MLEEYKLVYKGSKEGRKRNEAESEKGPKSS